MSKIGDYNLMVQEQEDANDVTKTLQLAQDKLNNMKAKADISGSKPKASITQRFREFVNKNSLSGTIQKKNYLKAEAWQYLAHLLGLRVVTDCTALVNMHEPDPDKNFLGVKCYCSLYDKDGRVVGSGTMTAQCREAFLENKDDYAVYGMAQTRAISRAMRNSYGWIARDAGYEATPWDEIPK